MTIITIDSFYNYVLEEHLKNIINYNLIIIEKVSYFYTLLKSLFIKNVNKIIYHFDLVIDKSLFIQIVI